MASAPHIRLIEANAFERFVPFRFAFCFGAAAVGLGDALDANDLSVRLDDGLPETREEVIAAYWRRSAVEPDWSAMNPLS